MNLDRASLARLLSLDDKSFAELIKKIALAAGADSSKTTELVKNIDFLRGTLARMSPEEAEKMLTSAGRDKSEEILKIIRGY